MVMDLLNAEKIFTYDNVYSEVDCVEIDYINGKQFLKFACIPLGLNQQQFVAIDTNTITKVVFRDVLTPGLKTVKDVMDAFKNGRLVGR